MSENQKSEQKSKTGEIPFVDYLVLGEDPYLQANDANLVEHDILIEEMLAPVVLRIISGKFL